MAGLMVRFRRILRNICDQTTVHGLNIVGKPNLHFLERLCWSILVMASAAGAIFLAHSNYSRYMANPTVISLKKDFRNWENPFPSVTGCFSDKTDRKMAQTLIYEKWGLKPSDPTYDFYLDYVQTVANISFKNLQNFKKFIKNDALKTVNMLEIAVKVHPKMSGTLVTFDPKNKVNWKIILSEMGICFNVNSKYGNLLSVKQNDYSFEENSKNNHLLRCHYLNGLCYARYDSDPQLPLLYYVHSYLDVIHATSDPPLIVHESEELEMNYRMQETVAYEDIRYLSPQQRGCRFDDEPLTQDLPAYSTTLCYIHCRYRLIMKLCGCRPFFYHFLSGKICDIDGLVCVSRFVENITQSPSQLGCHCPQPCDTIMYLPQTPKVTKWEHGYFDQRITFRWGLLPPTTKYHREVLFGLNDLFVSFGGTIALFLGLSCISVIELFILILENLFKEYQDSKKTKDLVLKRI